MNIKKDFGLRVKELRVQKGITQFKLAEMIEIDPKHMSHIETGRSFPKADLIEKLAHALDVDYPEFFKTEHLRTRKYMSDKINILIQKMDDSDLSKFFKLISNFVD